MSDPVIKEPSMSDYDTKALLVREVARILNVESVDADTGLGELGIDSLNVVEIILACETIYGKVVDPEILKLDQYTTLNDLDEQIHSNVHA
jgi:acyl carrier protein